MTALYIASKILTFPGAYIKGFWEHLTCKILGLPVEVPGYLRIDEACGHVEHVLPKGGFSAYLMSTGPAFMNFNIGIWIFLAGFVNLYYMGITPYDSVALFVMYVLMTYVGASMLCNVFPLVEDAMNLYDLLYSQKKGNAVGRIFAFIPTVVTYAGAYLEKYCITTVLWIVFILLAFVF
ncbi:MAG: hypothetical protein E7547_06215 [Ruminococcaceae bacterium]|nr:hypothetical protein [Oscillospiraceae bacterium]